MEFSSSPCFSKAYFNPYTHFICTNVSYGDNIYIDASHGKERFFNFEKKKIKIPQGRLKKILEIFCGRHFCSLNIVILFYLIFSTEKSCRSETLKCSLMGGSQKSTVFFCYNVMLRVFRVHISAKDFGDGSEIARCGEPQWSWLKSEIQ